MKFSIASYSFHRELAAGRQDMFKYIQDSRDMGMAQLDPWNGHLGVIGKEDEAINAESNPEKAKYSAQANKYVKKVKAAADEAGLPFGCLAVDGAHIYEDSPEKRRANQAMAYRWLDIAAKFDAKQLRIDAGGPKEMPDDVFEIIVEGYNDLIARAHDKGIEILFENHWGPTRTPSGPTVVSFSA